LLTKNKFKKDDPLQVGFLEDLVLFVVKGFLPMKFVELIWFQRLSYKLCPQIVFPSRKDFVENVLPSLVEKTMVIYVQLALTNCLSTTCTFDQWMSKGTNDIFVVVVNYALAPTIWNPSMCLLAYLR
jgi:hypothetical protein